MRALLFLFSLSIITPFLSNGQTADINRKIDVLKFRSDFIKDRYDILVSFPAHYDSTERNLPVLYIFDPDFYFLQFILSYDSLEKRGLAPRALIVGVGYGTNFLDRSYKVLRDLTPSRPQQKEYDEDIAIIPRDSITKYSGGSDTFFAYLREELFPCIETNFNTDPEGRIAFGNGYGGLFLCYVLMKQPNLFKKLNISSPLIWWNDETLIKTAKSDDEAEIFFSYGQKESKQTISSCKRYASIKKGEHFTYRAFNSEDDHTVIPMAFREGFILLFSRK